jgi:radical SAM protein with 4Fe4S-binding SPASM domain
VLRELCIEITKRCLLNCLYCSSDSSFDSREALDKKIIMATIDEFESLGGKKLEISGGEPLLHPEIWDILDYCRYKNFQTILYTSGIANFSLAEIIRRIKTERVIINLQGDKKITKEVTGKDCYQRIKKFALKLWKKGVKTEVHFVPMRFNYKRFENLVKECKKLGIKEIKILRLMPQGRALANWKKIHLPEIELKKFLREAKKMSDSKIKIKFGNPVLLYIRPTQIKCKAGISTCLIAPDGNVYPCPALKTKKSFSVGNILQEPLTEIWKKGFESLRRFKKISRYGRCLAPWIVTDSNILKIIEEISGGNFAKL